MRMNHFIVTRMLNPAANLRSEVFLWRQWNRLGQAISHFGEPCEFFR
jgi:hypothetical protein